MYETELATAIQAAREAGNIIAKYFDGPYTITEKGNDIPEGTPLGPVTNADREANTLIHKILLSAYPNDGWLSEETVDDERRLSKKRVWIVDPLDGTKEFIDKVKEFAVSIALCVEGLPVVGVIYNPLTRELFSTRKGSGAFRNYQNIHVSEHTELKSAKILASRSELKRDEWKKFEGKFQIVPSGGMAWKMAIVASGKADGSFTLQPKSEWDFCAGALMVQEAGGIVTGTSGQPFRFNQKNPRVSGIIYANPHLHSHLTRLVKSK